MTKQLDTLPDDIYDLFDPDVEHEVSEENLDLIADNIKNLLRERLKKKDPNVYLRFSSLGQCERKLYYANNGFGGEALTQQTYLKFLYGDFIEELILFLAREAGHSVERTQEEVESLGVKGHIDAVIDGVVVDVKSAAPFSFTKFTSGRIFDDDPFGYVQQLSGYSQKLNPGKDAAWVVMDKVSGEIAVVNLSSTIIDQYVIDDRIKQVKDIIAAETPPERPYEAVPEGKSGNMALGVTCSYCEFKGSCWPGLRAFAYSGRPKFLTKVEKEPNVPEFKI